ncbi:alcohol dehydrogenase 1-like [Engraulis encrasicolus]|uniref:alcohol dehydrogenase 1-like n=1 Tax=Engraulis encrasicolus TaxID=184585 RepID=UPI002FD2E511
MATAGKVIKCKAAVAWKPNAPLVMEEIEVAPPQKGEVRIKIIATGVCHTDLYHLFEGKHEEGFPAVLGHEGAGIVESVGEGVTEFKTGDKVIPLFISQCGSCMFCKCPKTNLCEESWASMRYGIMSEEDSRFTCRGQKILQFMGTSTFSEYTVLNQIAVAKIADDARLDRVCLLGCGISTGYGAAVNTAAVTPGSTCAVFGMGAVGLAAVMGCRNAGASRIIAIDVKDEKCAKAKALGATEFINSKKHSKPISEVLIEMTNGGVDFSLECVGSVQVMRSALEACQRGWGVSVIVGWTDMEDFSARPIQLIAGKTWKGSLFGGLGKDSVPQLVLDYKSGKINLDEFVTHNMPLAKVNDAIELMKTGECIRTILAVCPQ